MQVICIMEKSFLDKRKADIEYNLDVINEKIAESAIKSGRNPTKSVVFIVKVDIF